MTGKLQIDFTGNTSAGLYFRQAHDDFHLDVGAKVAWTYAVSTTPGIYQVWRDGTRGSMGGNIAGIYLGTISEAGAIVMKTLGNVPLEGVGTINALYEGAPVNLTFGVQNDYRSTGNAALWVGTLAPRVLNNLPVRIEIVGTSPTTQQPSQIKGPFTITGTKFWIETGAWRVWFDVDSDPDPDIGIPIAVLLANTDIATAARTGIEKKARTLGWEGN